MALSNQHKNRMRQVIRTTMITLAVLILVIALAIPVTNNAVALGVENRLKDLPLPAGAQRIASVSVAGKLTGSGNGMQYYGAILVQSELAKEQMVAHYSDYRQSVFDCMVEDADGARAMLSDLPLAEVEPAFNADAIADNYYLVYSWGDAPDWLWDILNMDMRAH